MTDWQKDIREATGLEAETRGTRLASSLNRRIDALTTDDRPRSAIVADMAREAGISVSTVSDILRAKINCPPLNRLAGFARALRTSAAGLRRDAERDGCQYGDRGIVNAMRNWVRKRRCARCEDR
jgi:transcriptional regulator with XRE-family HTH domain